MKHEVRVITKGHFGIYDLPICVKVTAAGALQAARKRLGAWKNLRELRPFTDSGGDAKSAGCLILNYRPYFPSTQNAPSGWNALAGATYFEGLVNPFGANRAALGYTRALEGTAASFRSAFANPENGAWTLRVRVLQAPVPDGATSPPRQVYAWQWGNNDPAGMGAGVSGRWQFQIADGHPILMRLSATWTQSGEDALNALLAVENPNPTQQTQIDTYRHDLYVSYDELGLDGDWFGRARTITFLPEPCGLVNIIDEDGGRTLTIEHGDILKTREAGVVWPASLVTFTTSGGAAFWQTGYPAFFTPGVLRLGEYNAVTADLGDFIASGLWDTSTPGTDLTLENEVINDAKAEIVATLSTTTNRFTPFFYSGWGLVEGGERDGDDAVSFDSNDHLDVHGNGPALDASPVFESEAEDVIRRRGYDLQLRNVNGELLLPGFHYQALENRMCRIDIGGVTVLNNALVKSSVINDAVKVTPDLNPTEVYNQKTTVALEIADGWALLDEFIFDAFDIVIVGDDQLLGFHARQVLRAVGWTESEVAGVNANPNLPDLGDPGPRLPKAALGEEPVVIAQGGQSAGDYLRNLYARYGRGLQLFQSNDGIWTQAAPSTASVADFTSDPTQNGSTRYINTGPLDLPRDSSQFWNFYKVKGANGPDGLPIVRCWTIQESIQAVPAGSNPSRKLIGRRKAHPVIYDDSLRTEDAVADVLRTTVEQTGKPGRFMAFLSYFHKLLRPGQRVTYDTVPCEISRIEGGSAKKDEMNLVFQEVE